VLKPKRGLRQNCQNTPVKMQWNAANLTAPFLSLLSQQTAVSKQNYPFPKGTI